MLPYGEDWRKWRKVRKCLSSILYFLLTIVCQVLHAGFHSRQAAKYKEIQTLESKQAMFQILNDPKHWNRHLQRFVSPLVYYSFVLRNYFFSDTLLLL